MAPAPQATLAEKVMLLPNFTRAVGSAVLSLITYPVSGSPRANTLFKDTVFALLRKNLTLMSVAQEQWVNPATESVYLDFTKKHKFQPDTTVLGSGLKLHWLGSKTAQKIILYFHGGGYVLSCSAGHLQWLFDLQNELAKTESISVVLVGYTLAPHGEYPTQLKEAAESLDWLLSSQEKKPGDVRPSRTYRNCHHSDQRHRFL